MRIDKFVTQINALAATSTPIVYPRAEGNFVPPPITSCQLNVTSIGAIKAGHTTIAPTVTSWCDCNNGAVSTNALSTKAGASQTSYVVCNVSPAPITVATIEPPSSSESASGSKSTSTSARPAPMEFPTMDEKFWFDKGITLAVNWLKAQMTSWKFKKLVKETELGFWDWLMGTYMPGVSKTIADCDGVNTCSTISCSMIQNAGDDTLAACAGLEAMARIQKIQNVIRASGHNACTRLTTMLEGMFEMFSDTNGLIASKDSKDRRVHMIVDILQAVVTVATAFAGPMVAPFAAATEVAVVNGIEKIVLTKSAEFVKKNIQPAVGTVTSLVNGAVTAGKNFGFSLGKKKDPKEARRLAFIQIKEVFANICAANDESASEVVVRLLAGDTLESGHDILDIIESGMYSRDIKRTKDLDEAGNEHFFNVALRDIWVDGGFGWVYFVAAHAQDGVCENDHRVPKQTRMCLKEHPGIVIEQVFIGEEFEGTKDVGLMRPFPGFENLESNKYGSKLTMAEIAKQSWEYFQENGNARMSIEAGTKRAADARWWLPGGKTPSMWDIPICFSPGGDAITSIEETKGRNPPCLCMDRYGKIIDTEAFLQKSGLYRSTQVALHCNRNTESDGKAWQFDETNGPKAEGMKNRWTVWNDVKDHFEKNEHYPVNKGMWLPGDYGDWKGPNKDCRLDAQKKYDDKGEWKKHPNCVDFWKEYDKPY